MYAYRIKAVFPSHSSSVVLSIFVSDRTKNEVALLITQQGWIVKNISLATESELAQLPLFQDVHQNVRKIIAEREAQKTAEQERVERRTANAKVDEQHARERAAKIAADARIAEERARAAARVEKGRQLFSVFGDIISSPPEPSTTTLEGMAVLRQKVGLFLSSGNVNLHALYTNICIDCATFQGINGQRYPGACNLLELLTSSITRWFELQNESLRIMARLRDRWTQIDTDIRAISSRSYIWGGSGLWAVLSACDAESQVSRDESQIQELQHEYQREEAQAQTMNDQVSNNMAIQWQRIIAIHDSMSHGGLSIQRVTELFGTRPAKPTTN